MWRSVFLHEFIDHRIDNFHALPGRLTLASSQHAATRDSATGVNSLLIQPGVELDFRLTTPLTEVIGISGRVRMLYPVRQPDFAFRVMSLGNDTSMSVKTESRPTDVDQTETTPALRFGQSFGDFKSVGLPARWVDYRFDWHTSGQARILYDGQLVAYRHSVSPGTFLTVDRVVVGIPPTANAQVQFRIARVFVRALSRSDALAQFSRFLPQLEEVPQDPRRCRQIAITGLLALVDRLRQFMAAVHAQVSQSWSEQAGPVTGPFRPEATRVHALAKKAMLELVQMMRTGDFSAPNRFLIPFTRFLRILHDTLPTQFEALAAELLETAIVPDDCTESIEALGKQHRDSLQPLIDLIEAANAQLKRIAGGH
jgi:hypothetical protein